MQNSTSEGFPFNPNKIPRINNALLVTILAHQKALLDLIVAHLNLPIEEVEKQMTLLTRVKMEEVLATLYAQWGATPDVLDPDNDEKE